MADLTTLAAVKAYGSIAGAELDAMLTALISRASAAVENFLQGSVLSASYTETRHGTGGQAMLLAEYPVTAASTVTVNGQPIPKATAFGQTGWWLSDRTILLVGYSFARGRNNVQVTYTAGYATTPPDIEQAVIETVMLALKRRDHIDISSKALAGETISFITADLTPSAKAVLSSYRRVAPL
jgi:hypothetical protein